MADYVAKIQITEGGEEVPIKDETALHREDLVDIIYPVGAIYMSVSNINPGTFLGGTWAAWGSGRVPVGVNASDTDFNTVEKTGGVKDAVIPQHNHTATFRGNAVSGHTHGTGNTDYPRFLVLNRTVNNSWINSGGGVLRHPTLPGESDPDAKFNTRSATASAGGHTPSGSVTVDNAGVAAAGKNLQPYITCYMWKRTA